MLIFQKFFYGMSGVFSRILLAVFPILAHITQFHYCFVKYTTDFQIRKPTFCLKNRCVRIETQAATTHSELISAFFYSDPTEPIKSSIGHKNAGTTITRITVLHLNQSFECRILLKRSSFSGQFAAFLLNLIQSAGCFIPSI